MNNHQINELELFINANMLDSELISIQKYSKRLQKHRKLLKKRPRKIKVALMSMFTNDFLKEILDIFLFQKGIDAEIYIPKYGTMFADLLDKNSGFYKFNSDCTILWPTFRDLDFFNTTMKKELAFWEKIWKSIPGEIIQMSYDFPPYSPFGETKNSREGKLLDRTKKINAKLRNFAHSKVIVIDTERLAARIGYKNWHDSRIYTLTKQPFSMDSLPEIAHAISSHIVSLYGMGKKALVLDLDNTLWGGEIGDLGIKGISIGKETPNGEGFKEFQNYVKGLSKGGVILCVCSKNEESITKNAFKNHPEMSLKLSDFACFIANFNDKASNIIEISSRINLGLESIVFADDSPTECEWVKNKLPEVTVINLNSDPSTYAWQIERLNLFVKSGFTKEDASRNKSFKSIAKIKNGLSKSKDLEKFLRDLNPVFNFENVMDHNVQRILQLLAKTNQFKLNTSVFSYSEIELLANSTFAIKFKDRLHDYGIVAVVVTKKEGKLLNITNWVMSCRVFSRRLEFATRRLLSKIALNLNCEEIKLCYFPSDRNQMIIPLLSQLGFQKSNNNEYISPSQYPEKMPKDFMQLNTKSFKIKYEK